MFYNYGYGDIFNQSLYRAEMPKLLSYIRLFNASPDSSAFDIYANDALIGKNLSFKQFTNYLSLPSGDYVIKVFPSGKTTSPILNRTLEIPPNSILTAAVVNKVDNLSLLPVFEPHMSLNPTMTFMRFVQLSPDAPEVDVSLPNGQKLFKDLEYKDITGYMILPPGNYTLLVKVEDTEKVILTVPKVIIKPNRFYTMYMVGLSLGTPGLQIVEALDGLSYIK